ncbi:MAG: hypothetical protein CMF55_05845 [Legionellales bacterium]|nr:hypothetical protein [Legionellales bacterium]HAG62112.1 hypothetical protein [Coxiellaceae bacterium]
MSHSLSKSQWQSWCDAYQQVDQTKVSFCRDNNLNYHQFLYWFNQLSSQSNKMISVEVLSSFRPLAVIRLKNSHRLEIVDKDF